MSDSESVDTTLIADETFDGWYFPAHRLVLSHCDYYMLKTTATQNTRAMRKSTYLASLIWLVICVQIGPIFSFSSTSLRQAHRNLYYSPRSCHCLLSTSNDIIEAGQQEEDFVSIAIAEEARSVESSRSRFHTALPQNDDLDHKILRTAIPSMINLAVVPIVNAVDTFWVGRMGVALALAGQAAANSAFFTLFFLVNYLPTITAPLVATAVGSGKQEEARDRVTESLFLSMVLGGVATLVLVGAPRLALQLVLQPDAPAMEFAAPYLRIRALSMVATLVSATGFAAHRGLLDTVTPLKVSLATNLVNLILDPLLMANSSSMGFLGAAVATAIAEIFGGLVYMRLLLQKKLADVKRLFFQPPSLGALAPLLTGGLTMLGRQAVLNFSFIFAARRAQAMDPTGVSAAAYGIVMQIYSLGIVLQLAVQGTAASLVPSVLAQTGTDDARRVADRTFVWGFLLGGILGVVQLLALPWIVPLFSTLPEVHRAVQAPAVLSSILHILNGFCFAGEGVLLGLRRYRDLMLLTAGSAACMVACLASPLGQRLDGIMWSIMSFTGVQAVGVLAHYLKIGPLASKKQKRFPAVTVSR